LYRVLPQDLRDELHRHINVFLEEKTFEGCGGLTITDDIRVTIASLACVLLLNRNTNYFPGFSTILVYPETYVAPVVHRDGLVETLDESVRAGESWHGGPVVLSWADVVRGDHNLETVITLCCTNSPINWTRRMTSQMAFLF
jgi:Mlc titration factor MtfA (ptsG expression regulator)